MTMTMAMSVFVAVILLPSRIRHEWQE